MERSKCCKTVRILLFYFTIIAAAASFGHCDARSSMHILKGGVHANKKLKSTKRFDWPSLLVQRETMDDASSSPYVSSPFTLPPYDSLGPISLPDNAPPYCIYPPNTPLPPGSMPSSPPPPFYYQPPLLPAPTGEVPAPPAFTPVPNPPVIVPGTPEATTPSPPGNIPGTPESVPGATSPPEGVPNPPYYEPSPPSYYIPSPPTSVPSPTGFVPSPRSFHPPVLYPPPTVPPSPRISPPTALWCVAKPSVPDPIIQEAMNYACGSGADCDSIQPSGSCFEPNSLLEHASYAFNSYWQRTKAAGGTCSFGGTAMLVTVDPSYDGCQFIYN